MYWILYRPIECLYIQHLHTVKIQWPNSNCKSKNNSKWKAYYSTLRRVVQLQNQWEIHSASAHLHTGSCLRTLFTSQTVLSLARQRGQTLWWAGSSLGNILHTLLFLVLILFLLVHHLLQVLFLLLHILFLLSLLDCLHPLLVSV